jgi:hypothetical protein
MSQTTIEGNTVKVTIHAKRYSKYRYLEGICNREFNIWQRTPTARALRYTSCLILGREEADDPSDPTKYFYTQVYRLEGLPAPETKEQEPKPEPADGLKVGQLVNFVNGNGVLIGVKTITGREGDRYTITPTNSPWCSHAADYLTPVDEPLPIRNFRVSYWTLSDGHNAVTVQAQHAEQAVETVKADPEKCFAQLHTVDLI